MFRYLFGSAVGLFLSLSLYTLIGSIVFINLEDGVDVVNSGFDEEVIDEELNDLLQSMKKEKDTDDVIKWEKAQLAIENYRNLVKQRLSPMTRKSVDIWKSLFYCFTIYTSIGYGNVVPDTSFGKLFTCIYAAIGIPLCLLTLDRIGKTLMKIIQWCTENIFRVDSRKTDSMTIYVLLTMITSYMFLGYLLYERNEKWSSSEALYFLFITFTTIGFGDISPVDSKYFILTIAYQFIGLSMMASLINMVASKLEAASLSGDDNKSKND